MRPRNMNGCLVGCLSRVSTMFSQFPFRFSYRVIITYHFSKKRKHRGKRVQSRSSSPSHALALPAVDLWTVTSHEPCLGPPLARPMSQLRTVTGVALGSVFNDHRGFHSKRKIATTLSLSRNTHHRNFSKLPGYLQ